MVLLTGWFQNDIEVSNARCILTYVERIKIRLKSNATLDNPKSSTFEVSSYSPNKITAIHL